MIAAAAAAAAAEEEEQRKDPRFLDVFEIAETRKVTIHWIESSQ
jgi:hypothetical protein